MLVSLGPAYTVTAARIEGVRQGPPIYASSTARTILAFIRAINASITIVLDDVTVGLVVVVCVPMYIGLFFATSRLTISRGIQRMYR